MRCDHRSFPVSARTANRLPAQSGKYTALPATVGVADTSLPVVNTHFATSRPTSCVPICRSDRWLRELFRSRPAIRQPPRSVVAVVCAPVPEPIDNIAITESVKPAVRRSNARIHLSFSRTARIGNVSGGRGTDAQDGRACVSLHDGETVPFVDVRPPVHSQCHGS